MGVVNNLYGKRFGRLLVVSDSGERRDRCVMWVCHCDCGRVTLVRGNSLVAGLTQSCGCYSRERSSDKENEKNVNWKGDDITLGTLHGWVRRRKPKPTLCERCGERKPQDLANISQLYIRDVNDFEWLCRRCHMTDDKRMETRKLNGQFERVNKC